MELKQRTIQTLQSAIPMWYNRLVQADWSGENLSEGDFRDLTHEPSSCAIGELHGWSSDYTDRHGEKYCKECDNLCCEIPKIVNGEVEDWSEKDSATVLDRTAKHIRLFHREALQNFKQI